MTEHAPVFAHTGKEVAMPRSILRLLGSAVGAMLFLVFASAATALTPPTPAAIESSSRASLLATGAVVDPGLGVTWIMHPDGGLDAVDLESGDTRWHTDAAARPLVLFGELLIAQAESLAGEPGLRIVVLDARRGDLLLSTLTELPDGSWNRIEAGLGKHLDVQAWHSGGEVFVSWTSVRRQIRGFQDPEAPTGPPAQIRQGTLRLDLRGERLMPEHSALQAPGALRPDVPVEQRLAGFNGLQLASADGATIVVSERAEDIQTWEKYRWTVVDKGTGAVLGTAQHFTSQAPFTVAGRMLIHVVTPHQRRIDDEIVTELLAVRGVDLGSGSEVWRRQLRESDYRGSYPP